MTSAQLHDYWDGFYDSVASGGVPGEPSAFARWAHERIAPGAPVVELGFGTARDAFFFANSAHPIRAYDFAEAAVRHARERAASEALDAEFDVLDLYDADSVLSAAAQLSALTEPVVYGRFLIHSLEDHGRTNLLDLAAKALAGGGELLLEFRTGLDAGGTHLFGDDHFRIYLDPDHVAGEIVARGGTITHREAGHGLAVYKTEDPHVARLAATFS
ncbi:MULTISPECIES: class I SAM-dependent methyltransferase [unclassified Nocardioides]|uniref:class I SAM-dependent methyltransferase n=1 Tax=unclassified Nocardioides TaxID=2615069 RepID=UPI000B1AFB57|nr:MULTISPECIES: class I SAM-dependent methyltransferase [unclassified Nocardioides]